MENSTYIKLKEGKLSLQECHDFVKDDGCGGLSIFVGTVRNSTKNKQVFKLEFSAYDPMAIKEMKLIASSSLR